ncbi:MAG: transcriptional repressor [Propionibacteriaceae bacterium]|nr:transcriptional repressor [Propionibacteriaceae bacterium]
MSTLPARPPQPGLRRTRQRAAITALLGEVDDFRTAQQIHDLLRTKGDSVGLTTVYRTLQAMAEAGEVDVIRSDGEALFRRCHTADHHHHLVCRRCGHAVEIVGSAVEQWTRSVATEHGFRDVDHELEIFGLCARC